MSVQTEYTSTIRTTQGRIVKALGGFYYLDTPEGLLECRARGVFRKENITPYVGDLAEAELTQDGKGYVAEDGNHRACIAKFFLYAQPSPLLHGVHLVEAQTDVRMENLFSRLKRLLPPYCVIFPSSREIARDDGPGWSMAFFDNSLRIENVRRKGYAAELKADEIEEVQPLQKMLWPLPQSSELGVSDETHKTTFH